MEPRRTPAGSLRAALYARVSTTSQDTANQLHELRRYADARGWQATEYVDTGISGSKDRRPALDKLMADASARRLDVVVCWRLDRFGRSLRHLVTSLDQFRALDVGFVTLGEGIDTTTPIGRMNAGILGAIAEFERERIRERIYAGLERARRQGTKLGRLRERIPRRDLDRVAGLSVREAAKVLHVPASRVHRERARYSPATGSETVPPFQNPSGQAAPITLEIEAETTFDPV